MATNTPINFLPTTWEDGFSKFLEYADAGISVVEEGLKKDGATALAKSTFAKLVSATSNTIKVASVGTEAYELANDSSGVTLMSDIGAGLVTSIVAAAGITGGFGLLVAGVIGEAYKAALEKLNEEFTNNPPQWAINLVQSNSFVGGFAKMAATVNEAVRQSFASIVTPIQTAIADGVNQAAAQAIAQDLVSEYNSVATTITQSFQNLFPGSAVTTPIPSLTTAEENYLFGAAFNAEADPNSLSDTYSYITDNLADPNYPDLVTALGAAGINATANSSRADNLQDGTTLTNLGAPEGIEATNTTEILITNPDGIPVVETDTNNANDTTVYGDAISSLAAAYTFFLPAPISPTTSAPAGVVRINLQDNNNVLDIYGLDTFNPSTAQLADRITASIAAGEVLTNFRAVGISTSFAYDVYDQNGNLLNTTVDELSNGSLTNYTFTGAQTYNVVLGATGNDNLTIAVGYGATPVIIENFAKSDVITLLDPTATDKVTATNGGITITKATGATQTIAFPSYFGELPSSVTVGGGAGGLYVVTAGTPTPTIHNVTASGQIGDNAGNDMWVVSANSISASVVASNTSPIFIQGSKDTVTLTANTSSYTITDDGKGTLFAVPVFPAKGTEITIADFQNDKTGVLSLIDQFSTPQAALAAVKSDGNGGSLLTLQGGLTIDFAGDASLTASNFQLHNL